MTFPNFKNKHSKDSMISPREFIQYMKKIGEAPNFNPPKGVIFCYSRKLLKFVLENHKTTYVGQSLMHGDMYFISNADNKIAIIGNFGIGAPVVSTLLEELIALGTKRFVSIGTAGALQKNLKIGDFIVCDKAIRDEGVSYHYLPDSKYSFASKTITNKIKKSFDKIGQQYFVGTSWTIDAPYRETVEEAKRYQKEGVATVDMEASALFAIAKYRKVEIGSIFAISDSLAELAWNPKFHTQRVKIGLETLYKVALNAIN